MRVRPRFLVHVGEHEHLAGHRVLDDGRHETFRKIWVHGLISNPLAASCCLTAAMESSRKWKTDAASIASAPPSVRAWYMWSTVPAPTRCPSTPQHSRIRT